MCVLTLGPQAAKAREDKRQSASAAYQVDGAGTGKRKVNDVDSSDEMDIDDESIGPSASKKVKAYTSGEEGHQDPSTLLVHGLGDQTPDFGIEGDNEEPREPLTSPSAPTTVTTPSSVEDTDTAVDANANFVSNEALLSSRETVNRTPLSHLPYGHLIANIPFHTLTAAELEAAERQAEELRRRRRQGRGFADFEIYEDAQARQDLLTEIHMLQDDPTFYSSPREEDKENSDESFGQLDTDGDDADNESEDDDDEEEDEEESENAGSESDEDPRQYSSEYHPSSSGSSRVTLAELTPFDDQMIQTHWRYSVFSARRGRR